jgi:hypothetical protein
VRLSWRGTTATPTWIVVQSYKAVGWVEEFEIRLVSAFVPSRGATLPATGERMDSAAVITQGTETKRARVPKATGIYLLWGSLLIFRGIADLKDHSSHRSDAWFILMICFPIILGVVFCSLGLFLFFGLTSLGSVGYEEIANLRVEQRVRERYASRIDQLTSLGFSYAFTSGESTYLSRMLLIYPATIWLRMWANGAVVVFEGGKVFSATPILNSADGRVFGRAATLGMAFCSEFRDKSILITKNYKGICGETPECVIQSSTGTITETWQLHKERLDRMDTAANPAMKDRSYATYSDIALREDAFIKSQR